LKKPVKRKRRGDRKEKTKEGRLYWFRKLNVGGELGPARKRESCKKVTRKKGVAWQRLVANSESHADGKRTPGNSSKKRLWGEKGRGEIRVWGEGLWGAKNLKWRKTCQEGPGPDPPKNREEKCKQNVHEKMCRSYWEAQTAIKSRTI